MSSAVVRAGMSAKAMKAAIALVRKWTAPKSKVFRWQEDIRVWFLSDTIEIEYISVIPKVMLRKRVDAEISEIVAVNRPVSCVVSFKSLADAVVAAPPKGNFVMLINEADRSLLAGADVVDLNSAVRIQFADESQTVDRPVFEIPTGESFVLDAELIAKIKLVEYASSKDNTRSHLSSVLVEGGFIVATDGYRMAIEQTDADLSIRVEHDLVPLLEPGCTFVREAVKAPTWSTIECPRQKLEIHMGHAPQTQYPDWRQVVPGDGLPLMTVDRAEMLDGLKKIITAAKGSTEAAKIVKIVPFISSVELSMYGYKLVEPTFEGQPIPELSAEEVRFEERVFVKMTHLSGRDERSFPICGCNVEYLIEAFKQLRPGAVEMRMKDATSPCLLIQPETKHFAIVMPTRL